MALFDQSLAKFVLNLAIYGYIRPETLVSKNNFVKSFEKTFFLFIFLKLKKKFGQQKYPFCPYEHRYDSLLTTLKK